jgi:uncharacterized protein YjbI with pentapeptide repeats
MKLFRDDLTYNLVIDKNSGFSELFELSNLDEDKKTDRLRKVLNNYFDTPQLESSDDRRVLFHHSTFKEYLMAEDFIETLLIGKDDNVLNSTYWMNVAIPTIESMQFLEGLLGLIKKSTISDTISKWIDKNEGSLFNSFKDGDWRRDPVRNLLRNSSNVINDHAVSLLIDYFDEDKKHKVQFVKYNLSFETARYNNSFARERDRSINEYQNLWIRRWIALRVVTVIDPEGCWKDIQKSKIAELVLQTSNIIPGYMKTFAHADLSNLVISTVKFSSADLHNAKMMGTDLSSANFYKANLVKANLEEARLDAANLTEAVMREAVLNRAHLNGTIFYRADLTLSKLEEARLIGAHLNNAIFNGAKMTKAVIQAATAYYAKFEGADLSEAALNYSNFPGCDFNDAIMTRTSIRGSNMEQVHNLKMS